MKAISTPASLLQSASQLSRSTCLRAVMFTFGLALWVSPALAQNDTLGTASTNNSSTPLTGSDGIGIVITEDIGKMRGDLSEKDQLKGLHSLQAVAYPSIGDGHCTLAGLPAAWESVTVSSLSGNVLFAQRGDGSPDIRLDLSASPAGTYLIRILRAGTVQTLRIVKCD